MTRTNPTRIWHLAADGSLSVRDDELAVEQPLEIRVRQRPVSMTMRTPGHDEELVAGLLLAEGVIHDRNQLLSMAPCRSDSSRNVLHVVLDPSCERALIRLHRMTVSYSSCGMCGKQTMAGVFRTASPIESSMTVDAGMLRELQDKMREAQSLFGRTGGVHAMALFDQAGTLVAIREDVGRHNALDKLIGCGLLRELLPWDQHLLMMSGRVSLETVQKAVVAGIPVVAAVSAPTSFAVEYADIHGQTLIGFVHEGAATVYTHPHRCVAGEEPQTPITTASTA